MDAGMPVIAEFPFLFGGAFIEAERVSVTMPALPLFPFLFGGAFIEEYRVRGCGPPTGTISLPFRRGFH